MPSLCLGIRHQLEWRKIGRLKLRQGNTEVVSLLIVFSGKQIGDLRYSL